MKRYFRTFVLLMVFGTAMSLFLMAPINAISNSEQEISLTIPGSDIQIKMRLIPAGTFMMGSQEDEKERGWDEGPQHRVTISKSFYIGIFEVTQEQWAAVTSSEPINPGDGPNHPITKVSWNDCQRYIESLNSMGIGTFRLPTEAEWEYACRAGTTTRFPWGDDLDYTDIDEHAWYQANSLGSTHPVGQKKSNAWGLFDMSGNVWEFCNDRYLKTYNISIQTDPVGPATGYTRVLRGGSYSNPPQVCRSAKREDQGQTTYSSAYGFRLIKEI